MFLLLVFVLEPRERELCEGRDFFWVLCFVELEHCRNSSSCSCAATGAHSRTRRCCLEAASNVAGSEEANMLYCYEDIAHVCVRGQLPYFAESVKCCLCVARRVFLCVKATNCDEPPSSVVEDVSPLFTFVLVLCFLSWLQEAERDSLLILKGAEVEKQAMLKASKSAPTPEAKAGAAATELKAEPKAEPAKTKPAAS